MGADPSARSSPSLGTVRTRPRTPPCRAAPSACCELIRSPCSATSSIAFLRAGPVATTTGARNEVSCASRRVRRSAVTTPVASGLPSARTRPATTHRPSVPARDGPTRARSTHRASCPRGARSRSPAHRGSPRRSRRGPRTTRQASSGRRDGCRQCRNDDVEVVGEQGMTSSHAADDMVTPWSSRSGALTTCAVLLVVESDRIVLEPRSAIGSASRPRPARPFTSVG